MTSHINDIDDLQSKIEVKKNVEYFKSKTKNDLEYVKKKTLKKSQTFIREDREMLSLRINSPKDSV